MLCGASNAHARLHISKQIERFFFPSTPVMEILTGSNQPLTTATSSCQVSTVKVRYLLLRTGMRLWLADNLLVDDKSEIYTVNPATALAFVSCESAVERCRALLHLFPDLIVDEVVINS